MLAVRIEDVAYGTSSFDDVKVLSRANQGRLGFLQWEAFSEAASTGRLIGAWIEDKLVGYCLYRLRKSDRSVSLTHVCVDTCRRAGMGSHSSWSSLSLSGIVLLQPSS